VSDALTATPDSTSDGSSDGVPGVAAGGARSERGPSALSVGVVVWLASELMFFSGLFAAWFSLRASNPEWPPDGVELDLPRTWVATAVLVASSGTMHLAVAAAERSDRAGALRWLAATGLLGTAFLANLGLEYAELPFEMSSHAYGSIFYLLTGFHGLHLLGGILFMAAVAATIGGSASRAPARGPVEVCAYYWHFVDVVWIAVFASVYLLG
jgi:cytochrome c oxidase subunit III